MNKLRKVGLTALTTTLVASSAYAGELSVSGSATLNYSGLNTSSNGNPWTMGNSVTFSGGGDLDNGMTVGVSYELDDDVMDDYKMTLGLGDGMGTVTFSGDSVNAGGVDAVKDIVPTAYTAVYENTNTVDNGLAAATAGRNTTGMWGYSNSIDNLTVSLGYNPINTSNVGGAESSIGLTYVMDGITSWIENWKKNNWKNASKKDVKNKDLWVELDNPTDKHSIKWEWVKGHSGDYGNEIADKLAVAQIKR